MAETYANKNGFEFEATLHHNYTSKITKDATCKEEGIITYTCSCGDSYTETVEKLAHTEEGIPGKAATCTEPGLTEGKKCLVCGKVLEEQQEITTIDHIDAGGDGKCDSCGEQLNPIKKTFAERIRDFFERIRSFFERLFGINK